MSGGVWQVWPSKGMPGVWFACIGKGTIRRFDSFVSARAFVVATGFPWRVL